jgi:hypothetical protein
VTEKTAEKTGRLGKQERLRELLENPDISWAVSKTDKGWIKQELNQIARGPSAQGTSRKTIRVPFNTKKSPGGKVLAHRRGFEARKGYGYKYSDLQDPDLHRIQHKHEGYK